MTSFLFHTSNLSWDCTVYLSHFLYFIYFWLLPLIDLLQQSLHFLIDICTSFLDFCKSINYKTTSIKSHVLKIKICLNSYWVLLCLFLMMTYKVLCDLDPACLLVSLLSVSPSALFCGSNECLHFPTRTTPLLTHFVFMVSLCHLFSPLSHPA